MELFLKNVHYLDWQTLEFKECHLRVNEGIDNSIEYIDEKMLPATAIDCTGKIVTKSFGCGHHHVYSALARAMPAPAKIPHNFPEILEYVWWSLDKKLTAPIIEASALITALNCAKNGVTFVIDHHASPFAIENSLEIIGKAFDRIGVSHLLCYEISDRDGENPARNGLAETGNYLENCGQGLVGLHASFTISNSLLKEAVKLAQRYDSGIHVHAAEDVSDQEHAIHNYRKRVIRRFADSGALDFNKTILAHCLHIDADERQILEKSNAYVVQNTESNQNNNVGIFNPDGLDKNRILLGTDGMHSDMLRSAKAAFLAGQQTGGISGSDIYSRFRNIHHYIRKNGFKGDGDNNLVILDYDSPTPVESGNFAGHFIYGIDSRHVESVISNGRLIVHNRKILTVDELEVLEFSNRMARKLWNSL